MRHRTGRDSRGRAASSDRRPAGPEKQLLADLCRATAAARGKRLVVIPVWLPGATPRRIREGALQAPPGAVIDGRTFAEVLGQVR